MKLTRGSAARTGVVLAAATGLGLGLLSVVGIPAASASPVSATLDYTCAYPLIGARDLKVDVSTDVPSQIGIGQQMPALWVTTSSTISADTTAGLQALGAARLEGKAVAAAVVNAPELGDGGLDVQSKQTLENVAVPSSGAFAVRSIGKVIGPSFNETGTGDITIGDLTLTVTALKADGSPTALGTFDVNCTQKPGSDNTLATFQITQDPVDVPTPPNPYPPSWPLTTDATALGAGYPSGTLNYDLKLAGSTFVKGPNGTAPLNGSIQVAVDGKTGAITGPLTLQPTTGDFKILGVLPVTASIAFAQTGPTTGSYHDGTISTTSTMNVSYASFKAFGAIPVGGGTSCQTTAPTTIAMHSDSGAAPGNPFNPSVGGAFVADNYTLSGISGCGLLNPILSAFEGGSGNTITATLSPNTGG